MGQVISFADFVSRQGWSDAQRAELQEIAATLNSHGIAVTAVFGETDQGEPWAALHDPNSGDVFAHIARINGGYVVHLHAVDLMISERDWKAALARAFPALSKVSPPVSNDRGSGFGLEAVLVFTLVSQLVDGGGAAEAAVGDGLPAAFVAVPPVEGGQSRFSDPLALGAVLLGSEAALAEESVHAADRLDRVSGALRLTLSDEAQAASRSGSSALDRSFAESVLLQPPPTEAVVNADAAQLMLLSIAAARGPTEPTITLGSVTDDTLFGGAGDDLIFGLDGDDVILGADGDDILVGGGGSDQIDGGAGDDILIVDSADSARGGDGEDLFVLDVAPERTEAATLTVTLDDFNTAQDRLVVTYAGTALLVDFGSMDASAQPPQLSRDEAMMLHRFGLLRSNDEAEIATSLIVDSTVSGTADTVFSYGIMIELELEDGGEVTNISISPAGPSSRLPRPDPHEEIGLMGILPRREMVVSDDDA